MTVQYQYGNSLPNYLVGQPNYMDGSVLYGYGGDDTLIGTYNRDTLYGGSGNDWLDGGGGTRYGDSLHGGVGSDTYVIRSSYDRVYESAGSGFDTVLVTTVDYAMAANVERLFQAPEQQFQYPWETKMTGNSMNNEMSGNQSNNAIWGGYGNDTLWGNDGADRLFGGENSDHLVGGNGNDLLNGEAGNDSLWGGDGDDVLRDILGYNHLIGGAGNDTLFMTQRGNDMLWGNEGTDTFIWESWGGKGFSFSEIQDYQVGVDRLQARDDNNVSVRTDGWNTVLSFSTPTSTHDVALVGVTLDQFNASGGIAGNVFDYYG